MTGTYQQPFLFRRQALAQKLIGELSGDGPFTAAACLFLAGPRRTGKSFFLRNDFVPEIENRHILPIYVDLWENKNEDPGKLIAEAIKKVMRANANLATRLIRKTGLTKVGVGSYATIDVDKVGAPEGVTLADALGALLDRTGQRICLIVDEAQHALTSDNGMNAMFALKAARDALNMRSDSRDGPNLLLVFTGSQRDKLSTLVTKREQPFFGSQIYPFPVLGRDYTDAYTAWLNKRLAGSNQFDAGDVHTAFGLVGHRPEHLQAVLKEVALDTGDAARLGGILRQNAELLRTRIWDGHEGSFGALTPVQKAVLGWLIEEGDAFAPFTKASLAKYAEVVGEEVPAATAQGALDALREKDLVWRSARGAYALEEQDLAAWYRAKVTVKAVEEEDRKPDAKPAMPGIR